MRAYKLFVQQGFRSALYIFFFGMVLHSLRRFYEHCVRPLTAFVQLYGCCRDLKNWVLGIC